MPERQAGTDMTEPVVAQLMAQGPLFLLFGVCNINVNICQAVRVFPDHAVNTGRKKDFSDDHILIHRRHLLTTKDSGGGV